MFTYNEIAIGNEAKYKLGYVYITTYGPINSKSHYV